MSRDRGSVIPTRHRAGTSADLSLALPDHHSADGWSVSIHVQRDGAVHEVALAEIDGMWTGELTAAATAAWVPGMYRLFVVASKSPAVIALSEMDFCLLPNPTLAGSKTALQAEMVLVDAAITAVLQGKGVKSYQIQTDVGSRQLERMTLEDLRNHKKWLQRQIDQEAVNMGLKKPTAWRNIGTKFAR